MHKSKKALETESEASAYLFSLLARRDYSRAQLAQKLLQRGCAASLVDRLLGEFEAAGYISDRRFVESQVRQRLEQGQGQRKIEFELRQKGVSGALISEVLSRADVDPKILALKYYRRRYGEALADDPREKARRVRHMAGRGFSFEEIAHAMRFQLHDPEMP